MFGSKNIPAVVALDPALTEATDAELREQLSDDDGPRRIAAACVLARRGDGTGFDVLIEGLDERPLLYSVLESLRLLRDSRALPHARRLLHKLMIGKFERTQAAAVLAALGEEDGRAHLLSRLRNRRRDDDRGLAVILCAQLELQESVPELERIAVDPKDLFRGAALKALCTLRPGESLARLTAVLNDESDDPDVRMDAAEALADHPDPRGRAALVAARETPHAELSTLIGTLLEG